MKTKIILTFFFLSVINLHAQWQQCNGPYISNDISGLADNNTYIFAATTNGVFRTSDGGNSWEPCNNGLPVAECLAIHSHQNNLYVSVFHPGSITRVYFSSDNGNNWTGTEAVNIIGNTTSDFTSTGSYVYMAISNQGVYYTTNNGTNWTPCNTGLPTTNVVNVTTNSSKVFAATSMGVYSSTNNGANWLPSNTGIPASDQRIMEIESTDSIVVCNAFNNFGPVGIYVSTNNGTNWALQNTGLTNYYGWDFLIVGSNVFFATQIGGIFYSDNKGGSWNAINDGLTQPGIHSLCYADTQVFAGSGQDEGYVFRRAIYKMGTDDITSYSLEVFPNPTTGLIRIRSNNELSSLKIINSFGMVVYTSDNSDNHEYLDADLTGMAPGIYFVMLTNKNSVGYSKIIVQ